MEHSSLSSDEPISQSSSGVHETVVVSGVDDKLANELHGDVRHRGHNSHDVKDLDGKGDDYGTVEFEMGEGTGGDEILHHEATKTDILTHTMHVEDDPTVPAITFRSIFLGCGLSIFGGVLSGIYYFKPQTIVLTPVFLAVMSFLLGEAMSLGIPRKGAVGRFLNPFPFNKKEHLMIIIMANAASISALGIEVIAATRLYYGHRLSDGVSIFLLLSGQFLGYGIAGLMRKTLVYPKNMLWPSTIPVISMLETLHRRLPETRKPLKVFLIVFACIFCWEIIPEWICPILTGVSVFCLANQHSTTFTYIFGGATGDEGLGLFSLCLDWQYISGGYSPLFYPMDSLISQGIGVCLCMIVFCAVFFTNTWDALKYPFLGQVILSNTSSAGNPVQWQQEKAIGPNNRINMTAVDELGLPNFSSSNVLNLMMQNMCTSAAVVHMVLWYRRELMATVSYLDPRGLRNFRQFPEKVRRMFQRSDVPEENKDYYDPHYALMRAYKPAPTWWFGLVLIASVVVALVILYTSDATLPWWGFLVAAILGWVLIAILGSLQAITGVAYVVQSMVQMIGGYLQPGDPVANMYFSLYGYNALLQGVLLSQDLKMSQYGHLAPRITFFAQMLGTFIGACFNYVMANSIITNQFATLRTVQGTNIWSGQQAQQFNGQAVAFGGLPHQLFSVGSKYEWVTLATLPGFLVPFVPWLAHKRWPNAGFDNIITPLILYYIVYLNVGINSSIMSYFIIGFASQYWLRKYRPNVFVRYNYLVSAALDGGTSVIVFILSFAVAGAGGPAVPFPIYWGNNANGNLDRCAYANG